MKYVFSFIIGLLFGIIPFSYILGLLRGIDLRKVGSGNIGATNLGRTQGFLLFIVGFLLDAAKGYGAVLLSSSLLGTGTLAGAGAILSHVFNPIFRFQGGKGVATTIGVSLALVPKPFLYAIAIWLIVYLTSFLVSLASICFALVLPIFSVVFQEGTIGARILFIFIAVMIVYAHRSNIVRILNKKEPKTILWRGK